MHGIQHALKNSIKPLMHASRDPVSARRKQDVGDNAVSIVVPDAVVYLPLEDLVDFEQEMERLQKEEEKLKKEIRRAEGCCQTSVLSAKHRRQRCRKSVKSSKNIHRCFTGTGENGRT